MNGLSLTCLFLLLATTASAFDTSIYDGNKTLHQDYQIFWKVDEAAGSIQLGFIVKSEGFFGFGLGEPTSGSMKGADIMTAELGSDNSVTVVDRFAEIYDFPKADPLDGQDWQLVSGMFDNGVIHVEVTRQLVAQDPDDRTIIEGYNRIIWSIGAIKAGKISYHEEARGIDSVLFFGDAAVNEPDDVDFIEEVDANYQITAEVTDYACKAFNISEDADRHIVQMTIDIPKQSKPYVHHILVFLCEDNHRFESFNEMQPCASNVVGACPLQLMAWAQGDQKLTLPDNVGFEVGPGSYTRGVIQVHYDNRAQVSGVEDHTVIKFEMASTKRQYDAGLLTIGDPWVLYEKEIPGRTEFYHYEQTCPSQCTTRFPRPINVFSSFLHMHEIGDIMWSTVYPADNSAPYDTSKAEYYAFNRQNMNPVDFTIYPGDEIQTHCVFNSGEKASSTVFGTASTDEMCMEFLYYWPRINSEDGDSWGYCGQGRELNETLCSDSQVDAGQNPYVSGLQVLRGSAAAERLFHYQEEVAPPTSSTPEGSVSGSSFLSTRIASVLFVLTAYLW